MFKINKRKILYIYIFGLVFSCQLVLGYFLQEKNVFFNTLEQSTMEILLILGLSFIFTFIGLALNYLIVKIDFRKIKQEGQYKNKFFLYFLVILAGWFPIFLAFFPGVFSYDGPNQVFDNIKQTMKQPILHTSMIRFLYNFGKRKLNSATIGLMFYTIIQCIIMSACFAYCTNYLNKKFNNKVINIITLLFFAFFPLNQLFAVITTKDGMFAAFTLIAIIKTIEMKEKENVKTNDIILYFFIVLLSISFRKNAMYAYLIFIIFYKPNKNVLVVKLTIVVAAVAYLIIDSLIQSKIKPQVLSIKEMTSVFVQSTAAIKKYENISEDEKEFIKEFYSKDDLEKYYNPSISDNIKDLLKLEYLDQHKLKYILKSTKLYFKYFRTSLISTLNTTRGYWYIADESYDSYFENKRNDMGALELYTTRIYSKNYLEKNRDKIKGETYYISTSDNIVGIKKYNLIPFIQKTYKDLFCENNYRKIPILNIVIRPAFYFYFLIAFLCICTYRRDKYNKQIGLFYFIYFLTCFLGPCALIRYIYVVIVSCPLLICMLFEQGKD